MHAFVFVFVSVCVCVCVPVCVFRFPSICIDYIGSRKTTCRILLPFHHTGGEDQIQIVRFDRENLKSLN